MKNTNEIKPMIKIAISLLFFVAMFFILSNTVKATTYKFGDFEYSLSNNQLTITKYVGTDTIVNIPDTLQGYTVVGIGENAFSNCTSLTSVNITNNVTSIGYHAFSNCTNLISINIPNGVTKIESDTFAYCSSLTSINIPSSVNTIICNPFRGCDSLTNIKIDSNNKNFIYENGLLYNSSKDTVISCISKDSEITLPNYIKYINHYAFSNCKFSSINMPNSITSIGYNAFSDCTNLKNITIPSKVSRIEAYTFSNCSSLTNIMISANVSSITISSAFRGCPNLNIMVDNTNPYYSSENGILYNKDKTTLLLYPSAKGDIIIRNSVQKIGVHAFYNCVNLNSVTIPTSVTEIADSAFYRCPNLTKATILNKDTKIANYAFELSESNLTIYGYADSTAKSFADRNAIKFVDITTYYTVTFKDFDGKILKTETVAEGQNATSPTNPQREGYTFTGWDKSFDSVTQDLIITAKYKINYTVTFKDFNGEILKTETVAEGQNATSPENPQREGYTFTSWDKSLDSITQNLVITAKYKINTYTVEFKDFNGNTLKTQTVNYDSTATAPNPPSKIGYQFLKWDKSFNKVTQDLVVTATYEPNSYYTVTFEDSNGKVLETQIIESGKNAIAPLTNKQGYQFISWDKKYTNVTSDITVTAKYQTYKMNFKDVPSNVYYLQALDYMNKNKFVNGTTATTFSPDTKLTRGMLVTILWNIEGSPVVKIQNKFPDVAENVYYTNAIKWASSNKIVNGYKDGTFAPDKDITREEVAIILANYSQYKGTYKASNINLSKFIDNFKVSSWAKSAVQWAISNKIINGKENGTLIDPNSNATRAEAITMIKNYIDQIIIVNYLKSENAYLESQINRLNLEKEIIELEYDLSNKQETFNRAKINLDNARENLEKVKNQKDVYTYVEGKGWIWMADPNRVAAAEEYVNKQSSNYNSANNALSSVKSDLTYTTIQFTQAQTTEKSKYNSFIQWKTRAEKLKL